MGLNQLQSIYSTFINLRQLPRFPGEYETFEIYLSILYFQLVGSEDLRSTYDYFI